VSGREMPHEPEGPGAAVSPPAPVQEKNRLVPPRALRRAGEHDVLPLIHVVCPDCFLVRFFSRGVVTQAPDDQKWNGKALPDRAPQHAILFPGNLFSGAACPGTAYYPAGPGFQVKCNRRDNRFRREDFRRKRNGDENRFRAAPRVISFFGMVEGMAF